MMQLDETALQTTFPQLIHGVSQHLSEAGPDRRDGRIHWRSAVFTLH